MYLVFAVYNAFISVQTKTSCFGFVIDSKVTDSSK